MPISLDFPEITDAFRRFLLLPVRLIAHHFEAISAWLEKRVRTADLLERASRDIPVLDFEGDAVVASIDELQRRGLAPEKAEPRLGDHLADAGRRFIDGAWGSLKNLVEQELILPRFFSSLASAVRAIADSVDRFADNPDRMSDLLFSHPGIAAGDGDRRHAGDLWGEAALAYRVIASGLDQFKAFKASLMDARNI